MTHPVKSPIWNDMRTCTTPLGDLLAVILAIAVLIVIDTVTFVSIPVLATIGNTLLIILGPALQSAFSVSPFRTMPYTSRL